MTKRPSVRSAQRALKRVRAPHFDPDVMPLYRALRWRRRLNGNVLDKRR